ncbi:MAG TPA: hypothetical protein VHF51_00840 [Solirubrobacteraceae bacterium]|nr:hypothetical protein [Solirubrobacteraceae bacterium]
MIAAQPWPAQAAGAAPRAPASRFERNRPERGGATTPDGRAGRPYLCGAMETDLYLELAPGGLLRWRRCARCGSPLADDVSRRRGFDTACVGWAQQHPQEARRARAKGIAHDRAALSAMRLSA